MFMHITVRVLLLTTTQIYTCLFLAFMQYKNQIQMYALINIYNLVCYCVLKTSKNLQKIILSIVITILSIHYKMEYI